MALRHPKAARMTDAQIAQHCGVSDEMVRIHRKAIFQPLEDTGKRTVTRTVNGQPQTYTMQVGPGGLSVGFRQIAHRARSYLRKFPR